MPIKIGDIEKMLPYGVYLHKKYEHQKYHSIVTLTETNVYVQRRNQLVEQNEAIREQRRKMQFSVSDRRDESEAKKDKQKQVPIVVQSSKFITAEKKDFDKQLEKEKKEKK